MAHSIPSSSPSITGTSTRVPSRTGTGTTPPTISPAVLCSVRDHHIPDHFVAHRSRQLRTVHDIGEANAEGFGAALEVSLS